MTPAVSHIQLKVREDLQRHGRRDDFGEPRGRTARASGREQNENERERQRGTPSEGATGRDAAPHGAPTRCCRISAFATVNHCLTYI